MGPASDGLVDVDLDSPEALALARAILPPTDAVFGRKSTPGAHHLYIADAAIVDHAAVKFNDPNRDGDEALLLELRVGGGGKGAQTVFPPSIHKDTGELIWWEKSGEPAHVVGRDLLRNARLLAACCLLARKWPPTGSGCHDAALAVGGFLARAGLRVDEVHSLVQAITKFHNPSRSDDLPRTAADAAAGYLKGEKAYGLPQLIKTFGEAVATQVAEWLEYHPKGAASGKSVPPPHNFEDWPAPLDIPSGLEKVPGFDVAVLPENLRAWLLDIADRMQVPTEFTAVPAMVMFGSLLGNKIAVAPQEFGDWPEVCNLWGMLIGRPGIKKSPAANDVFKPLRRASLEAHEAFSQALASYEVQADIYKKKYNKAIEKGGEPTEPPPVKPIRREFIINDTTYEKLGETLVDNPHGVLLHRDEIVSLLRALRLEQNTEAKGFYLQAWTGLGLYNTNRIIRGKTYVKNACVSLFGTTQPGVMSSFIRHAVVGGREDDGLIQRFGLAVWPDVTAEWVNVDRYPDTTARNLAYETFNRIKALEPAAASAVQGPYDETPLLRFTPEALRLFVDWHTKLQRRLATGDLPEAFASHLNKYSGLVARLALVTHLIDVGTGPVGEMSLIKALLWIEYLEPHAVRIYSAGIQPARAAAKTLIAKIRGGHLREAAAFTCRDVYRHCWSGLTSAEEAQPAIDILCAHHWLWPNHRTTPDGRPWTEYVINPKVKP